jgi:hypothetical protein
MVLSMTVKVKVKVKVPHYRPEGPEEGKRYSSTLS